MRQLANSLTVAAVLLLSACASGPAGKSSASGEPAEPEVVRPVVAPEAGGDALVNAVVLLKSGYFKQAEVNLEEIIKVRPDIAEAHFNLGWVRHRLQKYREALSPLEEGLKLQPANLAAHRLLALCQRELGEFAAAEKTYAAALVVAPDDDKLHLNAGILYDLYLFQPQLALSHYRRYQSLQPEPDAKVAGWIAVLERQGGK